MRNPTTAKIKQTPRREIVPIMTAPDLTRVKELTGRRITARRCLFNHRK